MDKNEKATVTVRIYESTAKNIEKWKENAPMGLFIDNAVSYYIKSLDNGDDMTQIRKSLELINERQTTNLGLLCEVLRQAGILNGNGEIDFIKKEASKPADQ